MSVARIQKIGFILAVIFFIPFFLIKTAFFLVSVGDYSERLHSYTSDTGNAEKDLDFSSFRKPEGLGVAISGSILASKTNTIANPYLYIPFYEGSLQISTEGTVLYDSNLDSEWGGATQLRDVFVALPHEGQTAIRFILGEGNSPFLSLSSFYIGSKEVLEKYKNRHDFYYYDLRIATWGAELFTLLMCIVISIVNRSLRKVVEPIVIFSFLLLIGSAPFVNLVPAVNALYPYFIASTPLLIAAMYGFLKYVNQQDYENKTKVYLAATSIIFVGLVIDLTQILDVKYFNLWVTIPTLLLSLIWFSGHSFYLFLKKENAIIGIFCAGFLALSASVGSDLLFRIGLIDGGVVSSNLAVLALFVITASTYTAYAFEAKNTISQHNETLKKSLNELQMELENEFEKMSELRQESALSKQMTHLSRELHDGILNYMSMIFALSENKKSEDIEVINRLSKLALSEIRIIINSTESGNQTLFSALSVLRSQLIEPIEMMGIKVEWSLLDLIDLPKVEPKVMLEVVRVFQEAIHNAVSRAKCTTLVVSGTVDQNGDIKFLIKNYGGTSLDLDKDIGFGISGMLNRAKRISAKLTLTPVKGGAELELILPKLVFTVSQ